MSLLRTIRAICIGVAAFCALALILKYFPRVFFLFICLAFFALGALVFFIVAKALKEGSIGTRYGPTYYRSINPVEYWFFVFFEFFGGALICITALYFLLHKPGIQILHVIALVSLGHFVCVHLKAFRPSGLR